MSRHPLPCSRGDRHSASAHEPGLRHRICGPLGRISRLRYRAELLLTVHCIQVWSTELSKSTILSGKTVHHNIFDYEKSHTFERSAGQTWNITYGDGSSASGNVGTDVVNIGGIILKNQAVELAKKLSSSFEQQAGDGLLGLAMVCCLHYSNHTAADDPHRAPSTLFSRCP